MRKLIATAALGLALALFGGAGGNAAYATEATHPIAGSEKCPNAEGWYANGDEADLVPTQKLDGLLFEGKDLIHHSTGPLDLADVKGGTFVAEGSADKVAFKMETTAPYSTIVQTPAGKFWSSKVVTGKGSQSQPVDKVIDLTDADVIEQPGKEYTGATKVVTFGVGYWTESGSTLVKSITFRGQKYAFSCKPVPSTSPSSTAKPKQPCEAYVYTGTNVTLCDRFPGVDLDDVKCSEVGYRVTLKGKLDPWGLDGGGDNIGTVGVGCESYELRPKPSPSNSSSAPGGAGGNGEDTDAGGLPVTGPAAPALVGLGVLVIAVGGAAVYLVRRRKVRFTS